MTGPSFWDQLIASVTPAQVETLRAQAAEAELRRPRADYDTGTVSLAACVALHALTLAVRPKVAIEVGTFIGTSTMAIVADRIYTCDKDNACLPSSDRIRAFPKTRSTAMFKRLVVAREQAQFFFFDGRIQDEDLTLLIRLSTPRTVYAFDDYEVGHKGRAEKGIINVDKLRPHLPSDYVLQPPPARVGTLDSRTTIAVLAREGLLL